MHMLAVDVLVLWKRWPAKFSKIHMKTKYHQISSGFVTDFIEFQMLSKDATTKTKTGK